MPTPSLSKIVGTGCTPPASTPPTIPSTSTPTPRLSQKRKQGPGHMTTKGASKTGKKQFKPPRKNK